MCNWHIFEVINANVFNDARTLRRKKMKKKMKRYLLNILAKNRRQEGFTLIEMVVVIAIIVILMVLIVTLLQLHTYIFLNENLPWNIMGS